MTMSARVLSLSLVLFVPGCFIVSDDDEGDERSAECEALDEPIEVVSVDRAYFVVDGHKRVALAWRSGREFIDAIVSRVPSPYELLPGVEETAILRTAREGEFRRHSALAEAVPDARFALTDLEDYGELFGALRLHALETSERAGRLVPPAEAAADWYASVYLPTVANARESVGGLLDTCTDADIFLAMRRQQVAAWGTACGAEMCSAEQLLTRRRLAARGRSAIGRVLDRGRSTPPPMLLPLTEGDG